MHSFFEFSNMFFVVEMVLSLPAVMPDRHMGLVLEPEYEPFLMIMVSLTLTASYPARTSRTSKLVAKLHLLHL